MGQHRGGTATIEGERGPMPRGRAEKNAAWDRAAHATVGTMCAEPGCLHSVQRRYPGLAVDRPEWCPIHATSSHPG